MSDTKVGIILNVLNAKRDAIHIAIAPVEAMEDLEPGEHVCLVRDCYHAMGSGSSCVGIVDPFLRDTVKKGEIFYIFLYPQTVTGIVHQWKHPAFNEENIPPWIKGDTSVHVGYLKKVAEDMSMSYDELISAATNYVLNGTYVESWNDIDNIELFWWNFEKVTGHVVRDKTDSFYRCCP